jgi:hypothetical protein
MGQSSAPSATSARVTQTIDNSCQRPAAIEPAGRATQHACPTIHHGIDRLRAPSANDPFSSGPSVSRARRGPLATSWSPGLGGGGAAPQEREWPADGPRRRSSGGVNLGGFVDTDCLPAWSNEVPLAYSHRSPSDVVPRELCVRSPPAQRNVPHDCRAVDTLLMVRDRYYGLEGGSDR